MTSLFRSTRISVATVGALALTVGSVFVPKPAQAILLRFTGSFNNPVTVEFDLETETTADSSGSFGSVPGGLSVFIEDSSGNLIDTLVFDIEDLVIEDLNSTNSQVEISDFVDALPVSSSSEISQFTFKNSSSDFSSEGGSFFSFLVPSSDSSLEDSLLALEPFSGTTNSIFGLLSSSFESTLESRLIELDKDFDIDGTDADPLRALAVTQIDIPEPMTTLSLLIVGAVGVGATLRNRHENI